MKKQYRSFKEARKFARSLKLITQEDWIKYAKSGKKPDDIPASPNLVYKNKGWVNTGDWLGTGRIANFEKQYRSFQEARKFTRKLGFKNREEWIPYCKSGKKPDDIPASPRNVYEKEWNNWGDWLGTGRIATQQMQFRSFDEARKFVCLLKFKTNKQYKNWAKSNKKPANIPTTPNLVYKKEFNGWGDFLGTGTIATYNMQYRSFSEARKFVHSLKLKNIMDWLEYCYSGKKPDDIPAAPEVVYKNKGWKGVTNWLGTTILSYEEAEKQAHILVKKLGIETPVDWTAAKKAGKIPKNLPSQPWKYYTESFTKKRRKK